MQFAIFNLKNWSVICLSLVNRWYQIDNHGRVKSSAGVSVKAQLYGQHFSCNLSRNNVALQVEMVCCAYYHLLARQIFVLQKVDVAFTFCNMKICYARRWLYVQQTISTCNATLLRDKLHEKCYSYYWALSLINLLD